MPGLDNFYYPISDIEIRRERDGKERRNVEEFWRRREEGNHISPAVSGDGGGGREARNGARIRTLGKP